MLWRHISWQFLSYITPNSSIQLYCLHCLVLIPNGETSNDLLPEGFLFRQVKTSLYKESAVHSAQNMFPTKLTLQNISNLVSRCMYRRKRQEATTDQPQIQIDEVSTQSQVYDH